MCQQEPFLKHVMQENKRIQASINSRTVPRHWSNVLRWPSSFTGSLFETFTEDPNSANYCDKYCAQTQQSAYYIDERDAAPTMLWNMEESVQGNVADGWKDNTEHYFETNAWERHKTRCSNPSVEAIERVGP